MPNTNSPNRILVVGATSTIAMQTAMLFAERGASFYLVARDVEKVSVFKDRLLEAGSASCGIFITDLRIRDAHTELIDSCYTFLGGIDLAVIAHGVYYDTVFVGEDTTILVDSFLTNAVSVINLSHMLAVRMSKNGGGTLAVISSVAGERGRRSNYAYGSAKSALTQFTSGLRAEFAEKDVHVLTIKPGVVDTAMTRGKDVPLKADVRKVAKDIYNAVLSRKSVIFTPWYWRWIMLLVRMIPESLFKKIKA